MLHDDALQQTIAHAIESVHVESGWDFSRVRDDVDPLPWSYSGVARRYLTPESRALDLGTGGGEMFLRLAEHFGRGVGIDRDPVMIAAARANRPAGLAERIAFLRMDARALAFADESFDVVLCHHAPLDAGEVVRVLRPGGYFITQQLGRDNHHAIRAALAPDTPLPGAISSGAISSGAISSGAISSGAVPLAALRETFARLGGDIQVQAAYNVPYYYRDIESLVYWLKALNFPPDLNIDDHGAALRRLVRENTTPRGIRTNVHREIMVVCKRDR